jgi:hypothetical protein
VARETRGVEPRRREHVLDQPLELAEVGLDVPQPALGIAVARRRPLPVASPTGGETIRRFGC